MTEEQLAAALASIGFGLEETGVLGGRLIYAVDGVGVCAIRFVTKYAMAEDELAKARAELFGSALAWKLNPACPG